MKLGVVALHRKFLLAIERIVVDADLRMVCNQLIVCRQHERIDLDNLGILLYKHVIQMLNDECKL